SETLGLVGGSPILRRIKTSFRLEMFARGGWGGGREGAAAAVSGLSVIPVSEKSGSRYAFCFRISWDDGFLEFGNCRS
ncbi:hypothetical protein CEXT_38821, partial [Caerostris extrusa]